ncbi:MAG: Fe-Mn family superoxide dismutase [Candidatus Paceibacterota bacterium]|jgi:Fe-Mn family superoxide dismutase
MYTAKNYENLLGLKGFSDEALRLHFTLYEGYVKNINSILNKWNDGTVEKGSIEASEIERRMGWEYNGMKLHEIYFESLSKNPNKLNPESGLAKKIDEIYGSFENWLNTFKSIGTMRGIGWIALVKGENDNELFTLWFEEHNTGIFANSKVIFCIDMLEHAFLLDFGTKKSDYINAFLENLDWKICEERFEK